MIDQDTLHTDSGLDTEEIVPASPPRPPEHNAPRSPSGQLGHPPKAEPAAVPTLGGQLLGVGVGGDDDVIVDGVRMVLVRDIGVQVCGDSPLLNSTREDLIKMQ